MLFRSLGGCELVAPNNPQALAEAIDVVIQSPPAFSQSILASSPFTVSAMTQSLRHLYLK